MVAYLTVILINNCKFWIMYFQFYHLSILLNKWGKWPFLNIQVDLTHILMWSIQLKCSWSHFIKMVSFTPRRVTELVLAYWLSWRIFTNHNTITASEQDTLTFYETFRSHSILDEKSNGTSNWLKTGINEMIFILNRCAFLRTLYAYVWMW